MKDFSKSKSLFERAKHFIPGGVNSPVRAFRAVGGNPLFMKRAKGAFLYDEDGNEFIDLINSWGPMILGHAHPAVTRAIEQQAARIAYEDFLHRRCLPEDFGRRLVRFDDLVLA